MKWSMWPNLKEHRLLFFLARETTIKCMYIIDEFVTQLNELKSKVAKFPKKCTKRKGVLKINFDSNFV